MGMGNDDRLDDKRPEQSTAGNTGYIYPGLPQPYYFNTFGAFSVPVIYPASSFHPPLSTTSQVSVPPPIKSLPGGVPPWRNPFKTQARISVPLPAPTAPVLKPPPSDSQTASKVAKWPSSLRAYVDRCFLSCKSDSQKDVMEEFLRNRINECIQNSTINSINWSMEAVPFSTTTQRPVSSSEVDNEELTKKKARLSRFKSESDEHFSRPSSNISEDSSEFIGAPIVGTSQKLEKQYLRLTAPPDPSTVRPLNILEKSLNEVLKKYEAGKDCHYICDQLKSIRQDITVQNIRSEFSVLVYESHARIAIQNGDFGEYNQCQSQLKLLYDSGLSGCENEFSSYRLLYLLITQNLVELNDELKSLSRSVRDSPEVSLALRIHHQIANMDFFGFLNSCFLVQNSGKYLIQSLMSTIRLEAFEIFSKTIKPKPSTESVARLTFMPISQLSKSKEF